MTRRIAGPAAPRPSRSSVARELEAGVLAGCVEACQALGIPIERRSVGLADYDGRKVRHGRKGEADLTGTIPSGPHRGARLEVEIKRPGERPRPEQLDHLRRVNADGGIAFWTDDVVLCLRALRRVLEGWRIELDEDGTPWVTDEPVEDC